MPLRVMPHIGQPVTVVYLAATGAGVVDQVLDGGRRLVVRTDDGEQLSFSLSRATAMFTAEGAGARLRFG